MHRDDRLYDLAVRLADVVDDVDPGVAIGAFAELRDALADVELRLVGRARRRGATWAEIATWSGQASRQAAHARASRMLSVRRGR